MEELVFDKDEDWETRTLCSDESCIGTIGPDGKCKECGKAYDGVFNAATFADGVPKKMELNIAANLPLNPEISKDNASDNSIPDEEWEKRILCRDESCIGVIGQDGKCKECGKPLNV